MEISSDSSDDEFMEELRKVVPLKRRTKARGRPKKKPIEPKKPAEPTKPMSAYALFFRDTQTAITAENPAAAFAEIAKIVASMWDSLSDEAKDVYKKKTDSAKHSYLQELAEYRASKDEGDTEEDDDKPLSMLKRKTSHDDGENSNVLPPPPKLKLAPSVLLETRKLPKEYSLNAIPPIKLLNSPASGGGSTSANSLPSSSDAGVIPVRHIILPNKVRATSHSPPPAPIQLRNIVPNPASSQHSPITFLQSKPGQVIRLLPAKQAATITSQTNGSNRIIKVTDMIEASENSFSNRNQTSAAADVKEPDSEPRKNHESKIDGVQPILQMLAHETYIGDNPEDEDATIISDDSDPDDVISDDDELTSGNNHHHHHNSTMVTMTSILPNDNIPAGGSRLCTREGCPNMAVADSRWNEEYCSAHCVVSHCHDVFDAWIAVRHMTATSVS